MADKRARRAIGGYCRISRRSDRSTSIEKQRANIERAVAQEWPGSRIDWFIDDGVSASRGKRRAGLDALRAAVEAGQLSAVVIDTLDRLTRDRGQRVLWELAELCEKTRTPIVGASQAIDVESSSGELSASVMGAAARFEARRTGDRVRSTLAHKRSRGIAAGGPAMFGLLREQNVFRLDDRPLRIATVAGVMAARSAADAAGVGRSIDVAGLRGFVPEDQWQDVTRAELVREAVMELIAGRSTVNRVATSWQARGVPTPQETTAAWSRTAVGRIMRSPALAGMVVSRLTGEPGLPVLRDEAGVPIVNADAALIDLAMWQELQKALEARATLGRNTLPIGEQPLLAGLVQCVNGHLMWRHRVTGARGGVSARRDHYYCRENGCLARTSAGVTALDAYVCEAFRKEVGDDPETITVSTGGRDDLARLAQVRRAITDTAAALAGERDPDALRALFDRLTSLRETEATLEEAAAGHALSVVRRTGRTLGEALEAAGDGITRRDLLLEHIEAVVVRGGFQGRRSDSFAERVRIIWREGPMPPV